jgi:hypothetical protein
MGNGVSITTYLDGLELKYKLDKEPSTTRFGQEKDKLFSSMAITTISLNKHLLLITNSIKSLILNQLPPPTLQPKSTTFNSTGLLEPTASPTWKVPKPMSSSMTS